MPANFYLQDKQTKKHVSLTDVDNELRIHLGVEPDEKEYYLNWVDNIGSWVAYNATQVEYYKAQAVHASHFPDNTEGFSQYVAVVRFLCERYYMVNNWGKKETNWTPAKQIDPDYLAGIIDGAINIVKTLDKSEFKEV